MTGSSPRSRGTRLAVRRLSVAPRFIPTVAGNTIYACERRAQSAVHPHGRGEHLAMFISPMCVCGSSPRSRGTPTAHLSRRYTYRFIPTVAGNTSSGIPASIRVAVHPHGRGEHIRGDVDSPPESGSSPRSRGTLGSCGRDSQRQRFIPTVAGNT